ncbi:ddb1 and cul4 associated factor 7 [Lobulomyces angularis]|nr:ddb1 and cul4 associated factor 7 [Lobulomyces angularis]
MDLKKEQYKYVAPWQVYALNWSAKPGQFKLGFGSFVEEYKNQISVTTLRNNELVHLATADVNYPVTKLMWSPSKAAGPDLLATTGDYLRIWDLKQEEHELPQLVSRTRLGNNRRAVPNQKKEISAPLTSFDWNEADPSMIVTSSIDTTCTVWNIETGQAKTQLIAHDKHVFDVAFAKGTDIFASVGADGSVRMFDLRALEHSTILYETPPQSSTTKTDLQSAQQKGGANLTDPTPLLRLTWSKQDPNYIATFQANSNSVIILDVRTPATPVSTINGHTKAVNSVAWAPHSSGYLCSAGDDSQALIWDLSQMSKTKVVQDPILAFTAEGEINQLAWNNVFSDWIAITVGNTIQALRV